MRWDFQASVLAHTFASPCFGCEPKAKVVTQMVRRNFKMKAMIMGIVFRMMTSRCKHRLNILV